jgi:hypothetical protein
MIDPTKVVADWEQDYKIMQDQRAEIARLRLTDEERKALEYGISEADAYDRIGLEDAKHAGIVFRGLLERLK